MNDLTYRGNQTHMIGQVVGPTLINGRPRFHVAAHAAYSAHHDHTVVWFHPLTDDQLADVRPDADGVPRVRLCALGGVSDGQLADSQRAALTFDAAERAWSAESTAQSA